MTSGIDSVGGGSASSPDKPSFEQAVELCLRPGTLSPQARSILRTRLSDDAVNMLLGHEGEILQDGQRWVLKSLSSGEALACPVDELRKNLPPKLFKKLGLENSIAPRIHYLIDRVCSGQVSGEMELSEKDVTLIRDAYSKETAQILISYLISPDHAIDSKQIDAIARELPADTIEAISKPMAQSRLEAATEAVRVAGWGFLASMIKEPHELIPDFVRKTLDTASRYNAGSEANVHSLFQDLKSARVSNAAREDQIRGQLEKLGEAPFSPDTLHKRHSLLLELDDCLELEKELVVAGEQVYPAWAKIVPDHTGSGLDAAPNDQSVLPFRPEVEQAVQSAVDLHRYLNEHGLTLAEFGIQFLQWVNRNPMAAEQLAGDIALVISIVNDEKLVDSITRTLNAQIVARSFVGGVDDDQKNIVVPPQFQLLFRAARAAPLLAGGAQGLYRGGVLGGLLGALKVAAIQQGSKMVSKDFKKSAIFLSDLYAGKSFKVAMWRQSGYQAVEIAGTAKNLLTGQTGPKKLAAFFKRRVGLKFNKFKEADGLERTLRVIGQVILPVGAVALGIGLVALLGPASFGLIFVGIGAAIAIEFYTDKGIDFMYPFTLRNAILKFPADEDSSDTVDDKISQYADRQMEALDVRFGVTDSTDKAEEQKRKRWMEFAINCSALRKRDNSSIDELRAKVRARLVEVMRDRAFAEMATSEPTIESDDSATKTAIEQSLKEAASNHPSSIDGESLNACHLQVEKALKNH